MNTMTADIIGGGLAGSETALQLAARNIPVRLFEMRPVRQTDVHKTSDFGELVCSNSLKSMKPESAAGMIKAELAALSSKLIALAKDNSVAAGGALAVDREAFSAAITELISNNERITVIRGEVTDVTDDGIIRYVNAADELVETPAGDVVILASGPLTSDALADRISEITGSDHLAFYDAAAPIVMADSLNYDVLFRQSRYEDSEIGDYLNAPFDRDQYEAFINELLDAKRVIKKDFESKDLFNACQPIEEIARKGFDAPRHGTMKPVGLVDPKTGRRPWAALQLRAENAELTSYNLVGFQTNLTFPEQARVFRMIPGLENAEFARYGVMHRNTFIDAPKTLHSNLQLKCGSFDRPVFVAGQLGGTEGYCEAIMSGLYVALAVSALMKGIELPEMPLTTAFGSLIAYATSQETVDYQPMHVNFGIFQPLDEPIRNKGMRYAAYAKRGAEAIERYASALSELGLMPQDEA